MHTPDMALSVPTSGLQVKERLLKEPRGDAGRVSHLQLQAPRQVVRLPLLGVI